VPDLSARERKALSVLLARARRGSNAELAEHAGLRLVGDERRRLNDLKLVESARRGREFVHELSDAGVEALIEAAYDELAAGPGEFVGLCELRASLPGAPRAEVDAMLMEMYATQRINLVPRSNQAALSAADREAALRVGGEHKHLISIER
jgi:hypothetical protein